MGRVDVEERGSLQGLAAARWNPRIAVFFFQTQFLTPRRHRVQRKASIEEISLFPTGGGSPRTLAAESIDEAAWQGYPPPTFGLVLDFRWVSRRRMRG